MLPCGKKRRTKTTWTHQSHQKNKPKTGGRKTTKKEGLSHGLNRTRSEWWWERRLKKPLSWQLHSVVFEDEASCHGDTSPSSRTPTNPLIHSCDVSSPDQSTGSVLRTRLRGSLQHLRRASDFIFLPLWSGLTPPTNRMYSTVITTKSTHCFTCWCPLSCQDVSPSLGDKETKETIFVLPLAAKLRGEALWFGLGLHSQPISFTVSKRMQHVKLFKSTKSLIRSFRCIFHCVK